MVVLTAADDRRSIRSEVVVWVAYSCAAVTSCVTTARSWSPRLFEATDGDFERAPI
jgi:hypothetical protein